MAEWPDLDARAHDRAVFHDRRRMHAHPVEPIMAVNSASAQRSSPTKALPSNFHTAPRWRSFLTGMRKRSPGTTGLRKRARGLGHGLDDQYAGHHRPFREMAQEKRFVETNGLETGGAFARHDIAQP